MAMTSVHLDDSGRCPIASPMRDVETAVAYARSVTDAEAVDVSDYDDIAFVLKSQSFALDRRTGHGFQWSMLLFGDAVSDLHGTAHFERRRLLSALFNKATLLQEYEHDFLIPALQAWKDRTFRGGPSQEVDLVTTVRGLVIQVAARLVGLDGVQASDEAFRRFVALLDAVERGIRVHRFGDDREAVARAGLIAQKHMYEEFFVPAWERRVELLEQVAAGDRSADEVPNDLITLMVQHTEHYSAWGEDADVREATLLLIAQVGSTTNGICFAVWDLYQWLLIHPEDRDKRTDPEFLMRCFSESQRLGQVNPIQRTAYEDVTLPSGLRLHRGQVAVLSRTAGNHDLAVGGEGGRDPDEFDPHRTLRDTTPLYGLAFGHGPHMCIGRRFVMNDAAARRGGEELGIGIRILLALQELDVTPSVDVPDFEAPIPHRPTWATLPVKVTV